MSEQYGDFEWIFDRGATDTLQDVVSRLECLIDVVKTVVEEPSSVVALLKAERDVLQGRFTLFRRWNILATFATLPLRHKIDLKNSRLSFRQHATQLVNSLSIMGELITVDLWPTMKNHSFKTRSFRGWCKRSGKNTKLAQILARASVLLVTV